MYYFPILGIGDHPYTDEWKAQSLVVMSIMRSLGYGKHSTEDKIQEECKSLVAEFRKHEGSCFNPSDIIHISITNVICHLLFGERYEHGDEHLIHLLDMMQQFLALSFESMEGDFIPILRVSPKHRSVLKVYKKIASELSQYVANKIKERQNKMINMTDEPLDLVQVRI